MASTSAASMNTDPTARVPLLASHAGGLPYARWRPQMQTYLMRAGIEDEDYSEEIPQWTELVRLVQDDARTERQAAIALLLGENAIKIENPLKGENPLMGATPLKRRQAASSMASPSDDKQQVSAKAQVAKMIGRARKAFGILYAALPAEVRPLVADVPQGYAYGVWSFLEKRYRNTEQDSVAALWADLTALSQEPGEKFDEYKARVDASVELLKHAKQTVPSGLYTSLLLWRLQTRYSQVVLALKTAGRLTDTDKIDWREIAEHVNQFERAKVNLAMDEREPGNATDRAMAARANRMAGKRASGLSDIKCYNCQKMGHYAVNCEEPRRRRDQGQDPDRYDDREYEQRREGEKHNRDQRRLGGRTTKRDPTDDETGSDATGNDEDEADPDGSDAPTRTKQRPTKESVRMARAFLTYGHDRGKGGHSHRQYADEEDDGLFGRPATPRGYIQ